MKAEAKHTRSLLDTRVIKGPCEYGNDRNGGTHAKFYESGAKREKAHAYNAQEEYVVLAGPAKARFE